jgi:hypothetical protein
MVKVQNDVNALPILSKVSRDVGVELCGILCAYRLLDVLYDLSKMASFYPRPSYPKFNFSAHHPASKVSAGFLSPPR